MEKIIKWEDFKYHQHDEIDEYISSSVRFKKLLISALVEYTRSYRQRNPTKKEIFDKIKLEKFPIGIYQKIYGYYLFEKQLSPTTHIEVFNQKLKHVGKLGLELLGMFCFMELIDETNITDNTKYLHGKCIIELSALPSINESDSLLDNYNEFRRIMVEKDSPTRNLTLILPSRHLEEHKYYSSLFSA